MTYLLVVTYILIRWLDTRDLSTYNPPPLCESYFTAVNTLKQLSMSFHTLQIQTNFFHFSIITTVEFSVTLLILSYVNWVLSRILTLSGWLTICGISGVSETSYIVTLLPISPAFLTWLFALCTFSNEWITYAVLNIV